MGILQKQLLEHFIFLYQQFHSNFHVLYLRHVVLVHFIIYTGAALFGLVYDREVAYLTSAV